MARATLRTLFLFVDGLGLPPGDPSRHPLLSVAPTLARLLRDHAVPVDPRMGVPGLPQSATGQTALLTGVNAAAAVGRHLEGLPSPRLKRIIREHNILSKLTARGYKVTFANAFFTRDLEEVRARRRQSVTTVATLAALGVVRDLTALEEDRAVYQDLTRRILRERGYSGRIITPTEAAKHLLNIAREHDFTLFEYFQTDLAAHRGNYDDRVRVLRELDEFLRTLLAFPNPRRSLLIIASDHGNIEDPTTSQHTANPVPFIALGRGAPFLRRRVRDLTDVAPTLLKLYP